MRTAASLPKEQDENPRLLLVQCCHLPQFFYIAAVLRREFPDTPLEALVIQSDDLDFYLSREKPVLIGPDSFFAISSGDELLADLLPAVQPRISIDQERSPKTLGTFFRA